MRDAAYEEIFALCCSAPTTLLTMTGDSIRLTPRRSSGHDCGHCDFQAGRAGARIRMNTMHPLRVYLHMGRLTAAITYPTATYRPYNVLMMLKSEYPCRSRRHHRETDERRESDSNAVSW